MAEAVDHSAVAPLSAAAAAAASPSPATPAVVEKVIVNIRAGPGTPILKLEKFKVNAADQFATLVNFLKKQLQMKAHEPLYCYINTSFCPTFDQSLHDLHRCFAVGGELMIHYCKTEAWG